MWRGKIEKVMEANGNLKEEDVEEEPGNDGLS